ncbi:hypothetical protein V6N13_124050 [Hibiscus sabdariffa]
MPQRAQNNFYARQRNNQKTLVEYTKKNGATIQNLAALMKNLEIQIRQIANALNNRPQGALPREIEDVEHNRNEQCKDKLEFILRIEVAQLCQEDDDDASSDGMIKNIKEEALEEVSYA